MDEIELIKNVMQYECRDDGHDYAGNDLDNDDDDCEIPGISTFLT